MSDGQLRSTFWGVYCCLGPLESPSCADLVPYFTSFYKNCSIVDQCWSHWDSSKDLMSPKAKCHECMDRGLNMIATATEVQIHLKLFQLMMHLFSPFPVLGSPTPSSIPAGNSAHSSEALSDFQCSSNKRAMALETRELS